MSYGKPSVDDTKSKMGLYSFAEQNNLKEDVLKIKNIKFPHKRWGERRLSYTSGVRRGYMIILLKKTLDPQNMTQTLLDRYTQEVQQPKSQAELDVCERGYATFIKVANEYSAYLNQNAGIEDSEREAIWNFAKSEEVKTGSEEDARKRQLREIVVRQGQPKFRAELIMAYNGCCAISGCNVLAALEAAHITPYMGAASNNISNGLLLRGDIHTLFDLGLISIDEEYRVNLSPSLEMSDYNSLAGNKLILPSNLSSHPDKEALKKHRVFFEGNLISV